MKKKNLYIISFFVIVIIAATCFIGSKVSAFLDQDNLKYKLKDFGDAYKNSQNDTIAEIKGQTITDKEIRIKKAVLGMDPSSKGLTDDEIIKLIAKEKIIISEAKQYGITISEDEISAIKERQSESYEKNALNETYAIQAGLTKDEIIEILTQMETNGKYKIELGKLIIPKILNGDINIENDEIDQLKDEINISYQNNKINTQLTLKLFDAYIENIYNNSNLEIVSMDTK